MDTVGMPGVAELGIIAFIFILSGLGALLTVFPFWKICSRAGFPGPLSLLMLVPIANIVLPFYIAFAQCSFFGQVASKAPEICFN